MNLPFFYIENEPKQGEDLALDETTSKHVVQVLRMQNGEQLQLTDGKGNLFTAEITDNDRKKTVVAIRNVSRIPNPESRITIAISLLKNANRFEWFLEKATEIGVTEIIPLVCSRTEKSSYKSDRMKNILVSAMLQSQQCWLPVLSEPVKFTAIIPATGYQQKFIAHCMESEKRELKDMINENLSSKIILIGPEGDFTDAEVELAIEHHFIPVTLGDTRLRTETAGIVSAVLLCR